RFDRGHDRLADPAPVDGSRHGDRSDLRDRWRILLEGAARDDLTPARHADDVVVDRERHHLGRAPEHQRLVGEDRDETRDRFGVLRACPSDHDIHRHYKISSRIPSPIASSSRVAMSGGRRRTVYSPAEQTRSPAAYASFTTCDAVPMTSKPHM